MIISPIRIEEHIMDSQADWSLSVDNDSDINPDSSSLMSRVDR
jgi:hypothetical protein